MTHAVPDGLAPALKKPSMGPASTCCFCFLPAQRRSLPGVVRRGAHAGFLKCRACGSSLFLPDLDDRAATARCAVRVDAAVAAMRSWYAKSGLTPAQARATLLEEARAGRSGAGSGIEAQFGRCPACSEDSACFSQDRRGRAQIHCSCGLGIYLARDLGLAGFVKIFSDLAPLVLRLRSPVPSVPDATAAASVPTPTSVPATGGT